MILRDPNPMPNIRGECGACHCIYDILKEGMKCPVCGSVDLRWASMNSPRVEDASQWPPKPLLSPVPHVLRYDGNACSQDCPACFWIENDLPKIKELERIFALEDTRHG